MTAPTMRALTLHAPWAYAVAHLGKRVENRTRPPPVTIRGKRIAIHAGLAESEAEWEAVRVAAVATDPDAEWTLERQPQAYGAVVAVATVDAWARATDEGYGVGVSVAGLRLFDAIDQIRRSPWFIGPWGWRLHDVVTLPEPVPCRGAQGVWFLPADVAEAVARQESIARAA
jgi:hypothetical protein